MSLKMPLDSPDVGIEAQTHVSNLGPVASTAMNIVSMKDLEKGDECNPSLVLEWENLRHVIRDKVILSEVSGRVEAGEMLAIMGPSGAGKSTVLDIIAKRVPATEGRITVNGEENFDMRALASYVEQSDALLGVLTVQETITFAARLSLGSSVPRSQIAERVQRTLAELGLSDVARNRIGNAVQRGVSGGQKRRVTIGSALVTRPRILFLDEPTSGLDSRTSYEVMSAIKKIAIQHGMIVIASIHQPNWDTFALFDKLLLLSQGHTMYFGPTERLHVYLADGLRHPVPQHANPADHALDVVHTDFMNDAKEREKHVKDLAMKWFTYATNNGVSTRRGIGSWGDKEGEQLDMRNGSKAKVKAKKAANTRGLTTAAESSMRLRFGSGFVSGWNQTVILMERNMLNYSRNLLAYGVRLGMYLGMGVLLATVWVNLAQTSTRINDRLSVHFFSVAFLGFMSVAGIPAFLEERQVFVRERMNGLYGPGAYVLANSICTLPYLFVCALLFAVLAYWSIGLHPGADHFFKFLGVLYLAVYAAESQSAVVASMVPIFVAALAIASFLNGFWMCVGGYFIRAVNLPRFWYYWAHFIDFQTYAFDLLVVNDLRGLTFECTTLSDGSCVCDYPSSLVSQGECKLAGDDVLNALDIGGIDFSLYAVILLLITVVFRFLLYIVLLLKKR